MDIGMDEILTATGACIYIACYDVQVVDKARDKASATGRTNTILFRVDF